MAEIYSEKFYQEVRKYVMNLAENSPLDRFFKLHLPEVTASARDLLEQYPEADKNIVLVSAWLHDLGHFAAKTLDDVDKVKADHHLVGAQMAEKFLQKYNLPADQLAKIKSCILCHRAKEPYIPKSIEEKIVVVADTLSHFQSIFYLLYFKIYPNETLDQYVAKQKEKLARDWRDLALLPKAQDLARQKYEIISTMLDNYTKE